MPFHWQPEADGVSSYPWVGQGCTSLLGLDPAALVADSNLLWHCIDPDDRADLKAAELRACREGKALRHRCRITTGQGEHKWLEILGYPDPSSQAGLWHCLALDISEQQRRIDELEELHRTQQAQQEQAVRQARHLAEAHASLLKLSTTDSLTRLSNRLHFEHNLQRSVSMAQRLGRPLSLVRINPRGLRRLNAEAGLLAGDRALQTIAQLLSSNIRGEDIAGRLGGVEFALLLPEADGTTAQDILERLHRAQACHESLVEARITLRSGLAECTECDTPESLLLRADQALGI